MHRTGYFHVLTLTVDDVENFLTEVGKVVKEKPGTVNILSHIILSQRTFNFSRAEEFEAKARDIAEAKRGFSKTSSILGGPRVRIILPPAESPMRT
jgi:hypothetical protein